MPAYLFLIAVRNDSIFVRSPVSNDSHTDAYRFFVDDVISQGIAISDIGVALDTVFSISHTNTITTLVFGFIGIIFFEVDFEEGEVLRDGVQIATSASLVAALDQRHAVHHLLFGEVSHQVMFEN
jgi:hypothetical protein